MARLVIVRRCLSLEEARVAWSFLDSAGIEASIDNQFLCTMEWRYCFALSLAIRVRSDDAADARAAFAEVDRGALAIAEVEPLARSLFARVRTLLLYLA
jgi:hypothetical protein